MMTLKPEDYLAVADSLPPGPRILPRLLEVLADTDSDVSQMVDLISFDPGLTSKLLRVCNSAFVGLSEPAGDVGEAVSRLGVDYVYKLAATVCGGSSYQSGPRADLLAKMWQHSVTSAFAAETLANDLGLDRGSLYTAALLHDIGKLVLAKKWEERYWQLIEQTQTTPSQLIEREEEVFKFNHGELGGRVLAHWKFPSTIASSVWQHHLPLKGKPFAQETACINLAEGIADAILREGPGEDFPETEGLATALELLAVTPESLSHYLERTRENLQFVNAMCQVNL